MIAAAGSGQRLGAGGPKALVEVAGRPLVAWCLDAFAAAGSITASVVAAPPGHEAAFAELAPGVTIVTGGEHRSESVASALATVETELVAVHDAARPLVTGALVDVLVARLAGAPSAAGVIAAAPITDTVKRVAADSRVVDSTEDREALWAAQTPQVFRTDILRAALGGAPRDVAAATDDAMLVERAGGRILVEPTTAPNFKVTTSDDVRLAEALLRG